MDFKKLCYTFLARVCCLLCHGHCCYPTMDFKYEDGVITYMGRLNEKCVAHSLLTGMCTKYKERKLPMQNLMRDI